MRKKITLTAALVFIVCVLALTLVACGGYKYETGDSVVDSRDVEVTEDDHGNIISKKYNGKEYTVKYLVEQGSYIELRGNKLDDMKVEGYQGNVKSLSLKDIEEKVKIDKDPISISGIAERAFYGCDTIETVDLTKANDALSFEVEDGAFAYCTALKSLTLPDNIFADNNRIGAYAFRNCTALGAVSLSDKFSEIGIGCFMSCSALKNVALPTSLKRIEAELFSGCENLASVTYPSGITSIGSFAFNNTGLSTVNFANFGTLKYIGDGAFAYTSLSSVNIPDSVTYIGDAAFYNCRDLTSVSVPFLGYSLVETDNTPNRDWKFDSVYGTSDTTEDETSDERTVEVTVRATASIPSGAFDGCSEIASVSIAFTKALKADIYASDGIAFERVDVAANRRVQSRAFAGCSSLSSLTIDGEITGVGDSAFDGCFVLETLPSLDKVKAIGNYAFRNCRRVEQIHVPSGVTNLGVGTFADCSALKKIEVDSWFFDVVLPDGSTDSSDLGNLSRCFMNTTTLSTTAAQNLLYRANGNGVYLPLSLTEVSVGGLYYVPNGGSYQNGLFSGWSSLQKATLTFVRPGEELAANYGLGDFAFYGCDSLATLEIKDESNSLKYIGSGALWGCSSLSSIAIPSSVETVGNNAFRGCTKITSFTLPTSLKSAGSGMLADCSSLRTLEIAGYDKSVTTVNPDGTRNTRYTAVDIKRLFGSNSDDLGDKMYFNAIQSVWLPNSLTSVKVGDMTTLANDAFSGWKKLQSVELTVGRRISFTDNYQQYTYEPSIGDRAFSGCTALSSVTFKNGTNLTEIGDSAFSGCTALKSIALPDKVATLGNRVFAGSGITSLTLPDSLTSVGSAIAADCKELTSIEIADYDKIVTDPDTGNRSLMFIGASNLFASSTGIADDMYQAGSVYVPQKLKNLKLGSVTALAQSAFSGWSSLVNVQIEFADTLSVSTGTRYTTAIGARAFEGCTLLDTLELTETQYLKNIGNRAFASCYALESFTLPSGVITLGTEILADAMSLETLEIEDYDKIVTDGEGFSQTQRYVAIAPSSFFGTTTALSVTSPNAVMYKNSVANKYIPLSLTSVKLGSVTMLADGAFNGWTSLTNVTLDFDEELTYTTSQGYDPITVPVTVGNNAFYGCTKLRTVTAEHGDRVTSIGTNAFSGCSVITKIPFALPMTSGIVSGANALEEITVRLPSSYSSSFYLASMFSLSSNGNLPSSLRRVILTAGVDEDGAKTDAVIPAQMFNGARNITSVTLTDVTAIGQNAFSGSGVYPSNADTNGARSYGGWVLAVGSSRIVPESTVGIANGVVSSGDKVYVNGSGAAFRYKPSGVEVYFYSETAPTSYGPHWHYVSGNIQEWSYTAKTYEFDPNNGDPSKIYSATNGVVREGDIPTFTSEGLTLEGWYKDAECTGEKVKFPYYDGTSSAPKLYAKWEARSMFKVENDPLYPFSDVSGVITSTNKADSSSSTYTITAGMDITLHFEYMVSSEQGYDFFTIKKHTATGSEELKKASGTVSWTSRTVELRAGESLTFTYTKDSSNNSGNDCGAIRNVVAD